MPKEVQEKMDGVLLISKVLGKRPSELKMWSSFKEMGGEFVKALDSTTTGEGDEWVPTQLSPELYKLVRLQLRVAALFRTIQMPTNPFELPIQVGRFSSFKHAEQTASTGQTAVPSGLVANVTGKTTLTAVGHGSLVLASDEVTEDSLVPMIPFMREELATALAEGREDAILNGDTAGSHEDTDVSTAGDRRKLWLGLRAMSNDQSYTADLSTLSLTNIRGLLRAPMGKYGIRPSELAILCDMRAYMKLVDLEQVTTVDKYGPSATVLAGELGKIDGSPVIVSEWFRTDLNSSGIYAADGTKSVLHVVNTNGFVMGERTRAEVTVLQELYKINRQIGILATERAVFSPLYPIASNKLVYTGINVG